ncbi:MAG: hypothetical protein FWD64_04870 [Acidobacteriaceae bacterium]|nr:hypothetical protein [Acidobacteriaceae bacterium]
MTTWIAAPEELCFRLATDAGFHQVLSQESKQNSLPEDARAAIQIGDRWQWPGRCAGFAYKYATRIEALRSSSFFREVLEQGCFRAFEHDHHFTFHNNGTRMRDEIRFVMQPGLGSGLIAPLLRRSLVASIAHRSHVLKAAAESNDWRRFLAQAEQPNPGAKPVQSVGARSRISTEGFATNR